MTKRWDIFCKVVDNFGDIGVCWRLAKQLHREHGISVRLWVDDLTVAKHIIPGLDAHATTQTQAGVTIAHWTAQSDFSQAANVVLETFACGLPEAYLAGMSARGSKWVNIDYLSAEDWVADFHAKPSPQANGLTRYFYFPGFTPETGGLIRETEVTKHIQNDVDLSFPQKRESILNRQSYWIPAFAGMRDKNKSVIHVSLFCYPHAPIADLLEAFSSHVTPVHLYLPTTSILPKVAQWLHRDALQVGDVLTQGSLMVEVLPFLSQDDYDMLLADCDLNFVRGEDSWVRAIWAGKPFVWQPYFQAEDAHLAKLNAFLNLFYAPFNDANSVQALHHAWLTGAGLALALQHYLAHLSQHAQDTLKQTNHLKKQQDLATNLVNFCNQA